MNINNFAIDRSKYDSFAKIKNEFVAAAGVSEELVRFISKDKCEPDWMLQKRLAGLKFFLQTPMPRWGPDLSKLDLNSISYYVKPGMKESKKWEDLPEEIRKTAERIGVPEAERNALGGAGFQFDSSMAYHHLKKELEEKGVIFENMDTALQKYPDLVKEHFMSQCVPVNDHKFAMLHSAVWSGGTFIFIPTGVKVSLPLQAYFRMNAIKGGQFEHTLIIADKDSEVSYIEGCSSPIYEEGSLHAGCVEIFVKEGAKVKYMSIENWSRNTYNLNTKRALVDKNGPIEWINGNMGCLVGDTQVYTNPEGPIEIQDIQAGDKVYVWDEKTNSIKKSLVTAKIFSGEKKVYRLTAGGREINASSNHPFLTLVRKKNNPLHKKGFFHFAWKPLEKLNRGDIVGIVKKLPLEGYPHKLPNIKIGEVISGGNQYARYKINSSYLYNRKIIIPKYTNEDFMWLAGILLGDGCVDIKHNKINIAAHETDDYRNHLCSLLKKLFNYKVTEKKERYIMINSRELCLLFTNIELSGTAKTKKVPNWVFKLPESQIIAFLAGYFDSDGHVTTTGIAYTSINKNILRKIQLLGIACGFSVSRIFSHRESGKVRILGHKCNSNDSWRIIFYGKKVYELPSRFLTKKEKISNINTKRSYSRSGDLNFKSKTNSEVGFTRINKIELLGIKPTYDIQVANNHNFIANGLIVHNSSRTMLYPSSVLRGEGAKSDSLGIAFANSGQMQDTGSKVIHTAPNTSSIIKAKSISKSGGSAVYRGLVKIMPKAVGSSCSVNCDALLIDPDSNSETLPYITSETHDAIISHEASVGKIGDEEIFYLMSRGLKKEQAIQIIVG
ncbi:MAG: Fe-S cluster assembly protein SufB, partial [Nanoarchaeota archaeon]